MNPQLMITSDSAPQVEDLALPVSARIRARLRAAQQRFHANDNISGFMQADHFCMHWRGVKDAGTRMINSVMRGSFLKDSALRREFLSLVNSGS